MPQSLQTTHDGRERRECVPIKKAEKNYKRTLTACYLGFVTQAISANFAPLLFLTFQKSYGISFSHIALISTFFYFTQLLVDLICAKFVDKIGYRKSVVLTMSVAFLRRNRAQ